MNLIKYTSHRRQAAMYFLFASVYKTFVTS